MSDATPTPPTPEQPENPAGVTPPPAPGAVPPPAAPGAVPPPAQPGYAAQPGYPAQPGYTGAPAYAAVAPVKQGLSLTGFILGIASIVFGWIPVFGILIGVAGLILALIARGREPQAPNWMKMLGLILSIVGIVLALLWTFLEVILPLILFAGAAASYSSY